MNVARADNGTDKNTASVARPLPRNNKIINPVSTKPMPASWIKFSMAVRTKIDWSKTTCVTNFFGTSSSLEMTCLTPFTTAMVFAPPPCFLSTGK